MNSLEFVPEFLLYTANYLFPGGIAGAEVPPGRRGIGRLPALALLIRMGFNIRL